MLVNLDPLYLFVSMTVGAVGFGAFLYGKKRPDPKSLLVGITMMLSSYFFTTTLSLLGVSVLLLGVLFSEPLVARIQGRDSKPRRIQSIHD